MTKAFLNVLARCCSASAADSTPVYHVPLRLNLLLRVLEYRHVQLGCISVVLA